MRALISGSAISLLLSLGLVGCDAGSLFSGGLFGSSATAKSAGASAEGDGGEEEDDDDVDCVDGIDAATGEECDGGPSANQDDGEESGDGQCQLGPKRPKARHHRPRSTNDILRRGWCGSA
mgnify:CR=1 FL=1